MPIDPDLDTQVDNEEVKCIQKWLKDSDADLIVSIIKKNKVKKLILANNDLAEEAAKKIAEAMWENTSITFLSLANNKFSDAGCLEFTTVLEKNTTMQQLMLCGNKASVETCDVLWAANDKREKPLTENLYGLVVDHKSPKLREREAEKAAEKKNNKKKLM